MKMKSENYLIIQPDEDGNIVDFVTRKELEEYLIAIQEYKEEYKPVFVDFDRGLGQNVQYWKENEVLIVKCETVIPKVVESVIKYSID